MTVLLLLMMAVGTMMVTINDSGCDDIVEFDDDDLCCRDAMAGENAQSYSGICGGGGNEWDGHAVNCSIWNDDCCDKHCTLRLIVMLL